MTKTRTRIERRRSQRGAATTEAVVAVPFFIIIFACTIFAQKIYTQKMKSLNESSDIAWTKALKGCDGGDGENIFQSAGGDLGEAGSPPQSEVTKKGFGGALGTSNIDVSAPGYIGGATTSIKSQTLVMCNEIAQDGDLAGVGSYLWGLLKGSW